MNSKKTKPRKQRTNEASPKSSKSAKPAIAPGLETRATARSSRKRGRKFRASGGDSDVERRIPVPTKHNDNAQRRDTKARTGALRRLGVSPDSLRSLPRISHILGHADGGIPTVLAALRLCDDDDARKFLDRYDRVSVSDRAYLEIEEICVASDVPIKRLLELAVSSLVEDSRSSGAIIAATYHPRIIKKLADSALHDEVYIDEKGHMQGGGGNADRKLFLSGTGFLPQSEKKSGGGVFNVNINAQAVAGAQANVPPVGDGIPTEVPYNAPEDDLIKLHTKIDGQRLLEAPKVVESPSSVVLGHMYRETSEAVEEMECIPSRKS